MFGGPEIGFLLFSAFALYLGLGGPIPRGLRELLAPEEEE